MECHQMPHQSVVLPLGGAGATGPSDGEVVGFVCHEVTFPPLSVSIVVGIWRRDNHLLINDGIRN